VIVIDLAEEPAIQSLQHMETIISTWPKHFTTIEECIHWSVRERRPKSLWAAEMSIPSLLLQPDPTGPYVWRTDLLSYSCYWRDWFTGFDEAFIKIKQPHCLILSCVDRLDPALTVGHMQGKFEVQVVHGSDGSHFVQEDHTEEVVCIITNFLRARGIITAKLATAVIRSSLSSSFSPSSLQAML
jgi:protein phosphatase methylesterase 1